MLKGGQEELGPNLDMTLTAARAGKAKDLDQDPACPCRDWADPESSPLAPRPS